MAESDTVGTDLLSVVPGYQQYQELLSKAVLEGVMEKLRFKANKDPKHYKSWSEMTKALRSAIMDKRNVIDSVERTNLQKVLDTLQKSIKVTSLQSMVERLDSITRQQGLKLVRQSNTQCYITSDMFYVEILLEHSGEVNDVKIAHGDPEPCPELTKVLRSGNFTEFTKHLEGLSAIYQLNTNSSGQLDCEAQKKLKKKAYSALHHLEYDLSQLWQLQQDLTKDPSKLVHKSPVGILQERQGGYSLKLTYFISPYDLLDIKTKSSITLSVDAIIEKGLGHSVTVCIESSNMHRLQNVSLLTISKNGEKSGPPFAAHSDLNSTTLPASFVLKLQEPIPIAVSILKKIQGVTKISNFVDLCNSQSLLSVIVSDASKGKLPYSGNKNLFVTLPDQHHCYSMKSNHELQGVLISTIPFTHPTHVPQILDFLRQQMLFNTVISSCVRPKSKKDVESALKFDIHSYSTNHIQVTFVHPLDESLAAVDLDLKDIIAVKCKIHTLGMDDSLCSDEYASKIMQRCLSIPVTMRAVIRKAQIQQQQKKFDRNNVYSATVGGRSDSSYIPHMSNYGNALSNGSSLSSGPFSNLASGMCNKVSDGSDSNNLLNMDSENTAYNLHEEDSIKAGTAGLPVADQPQNFSIENNSDPNSVKSNLDGRNLTSITNAPSKAANAMLMSMLNDVPSATSLSSSSSWNAKPRKRKATTDAKSPGSVGRSPKRKMNEDDSIREQLASEALLMDNPSLSVDNSNSLPASSLSNTTENIKTSSLEPYIKSEVQHHGYPQRSTSTDSYLVFRPHQVMNCNESSNPELSSSMPQGKTACHFQVDKEQSGNEASLNIDIDNVTLAQNAPDKITVEKSSKKMRKSKDMSDGKSDFSESLILKVHDFDSSEGSSSSDFFQKSGGETEAKSCNDSSLKSSHFVHSSTPSLGTSLKISKSGDGHRVSKSDSKLKQRDGRRSTSEGTSSKKKSEGKKDRKRRQVQSADSTSNRISTQPIRLDSSLMPPPTLSVEGNMSVSICDTQPKRPITLNVKDSPPSSSQSKPLISISTVSMNTTSNPSKSSLSKSSSEKSGMKVSSRSSHSVIGNKISADHEGMSSTTKVILNTHSKLQSKLKQSSSSKGTSGYHSGGQSSPNKIKSTSLKLKNPSVSHSSSSNTAFSKSQIISSSSSEEQTSPTSKQGGSSSKSHKSLLRSGKGALNAVIDKLRVTATHAQSPESLKLNSCGSRPEVSSERLDSKTERKEVKDCKDNSANKGNEGKNKKYLDQFTVKQSSQGIKLTVTKTKSSDGSSKHGKSKLTSSKTSTTPGSTSNPNKNRVSGTHIAKKTGSSSPASTKKSILNTSKDIQRSTSPKTVSSAASSSNPMKTSVSSGIKVSSSSGSSYQKSSTSLGPIMKSPKLSSGSQQIKKKNTILSESKTGLDPQNKPSISNNPSTKLAVVTPSTKLTRMDSNWQLSNPASRSEEDAEGERTFRLLLEQSKSEGQNGSEQSITIVKPADFSLKAITSLRNELDDKKEFSVSSSTDIKRSCNTLRVNQDHITILDQNISQPSESKTVLLSEAPCKKRESIVNASLVSSSEEINKTLSSFAKLVKQNECLNTHNEEDSSPDDGLVIDYPGTPRLPDQKRSGLNKKEKSPDQKKGRVETIAGIPVDERSDKLDYSQVAFIAKTPDQRSPSASNHSRSIPHESWPIDDDLMNMALTIGK